MSVEQVAVIGSGYWGRNLVRNFHQLGALKCVCDTREDVARHVSEQYQVPATSDLHSVLRDPSLRAVALAVPAAQHHQLVRECLLQGKDVYVEKPLALHATDGRELVELAHKLGRVLMVGHILQYHPAIIALRELIQRGELGRIRYIYSSRLNLGKLRTEENILWSFAPHDVAAILYLLGETPVRVATHGGNYIHSDIPDTTLTTCEFNSGVQAHMFVSWLHPFKEQKMVIVGGKKMAVFDDVERERKLVLYPHRIEWIDRLPVARPNGGELVPLPQIEPLRAECEHFLECVHTRQTPRTDGASAVQVLEVLEACERSLREQGAPTRLQAGAPKYFAHPTAVIDDGCQIGEGTKIWHFSHVMSGCRIGEQCNFGQNVVVSPEVKIGRNVKVQNNVSIYTGVELEDDVFCGPSMVFTNVINPRSHVVRKHEYRRTLVRRGASIGANATIVCGVTLGQYSFVGAGAVVTRDIPDFAMVVGVPAEQIGWVCKCGTRLPESRVPVCPACSAKYAVADGQCRETVDHPVTTLELAA